MPDAYISLGSNAADARDRLALARQALAAFPQGRPMAASRLYRTEPQGYKDQPWFLNQVVRLACADGTDPEALLRFMLDSEAALGRVRDPANRFGPRAIDMDLLLFGSEVRTGAFLQLPHPRMAERAFVLVPLLEIAPDICLPDGRPAKKLLSALACRLDGQDIYQ